MSNPKILFLDCETAPHRVYSWGLFRQNIAINQIEEPGYTLCFAAKWKGKRDMVFKSVYENADDMVHTAYDLLDEADAVVHYNGSRFDLPVLNQEFLKWGLGPPSPVEEVDLLKVVRKRFRLASNKLDYVCQMLDIGSKVEHKGMELWRKCMEDDERAWKTMERYNKRDVKLLEPLYNILLPWISNHPNMGLYMDKDRPVCTNCGSHHLQSRGLQYTKTMTYRRWYCSDCGNWMRERTNNVDPEKKKNILVGVK